MNRILAIIFSFFAQLVPYIRPSNKKGFLSMLLLVAANSVPVIGVVFFKWNPFIILVIYWGESAIIGFFNVLKMFIGGIIQDHGFSPSGAAKAAFFCIFFMFHYGGFMAGHGVFIVVMLALATSGFDNPDFNPVSILYTFLPASWTMNEFFRSELFAVIVLFFNHLFSFYMNFIRTGEYNVTQPEDYMMQPYKRIIVMHITILLGFFTVFFSGLHGAGVIIVWVAMKVIADLKINMSEETKRVERAGG